MVFILLGAGISAATLTPEDAPLALAFYGLGAILVHARITWMQLNGIDANYFYLHHPVSDRSLFRKHIKSLFWSSTRTLLVFGIGLVLLFREQLAFKLTWGAIVLLAVGMWLACLSSVLILLRFVPQISWQIALVGGAFCLSAPAVRFIPQSSRHGIEGILAITPVGSLAYFIGEYHLYANAIAIALIPFLASVILLPVVFRRLEASYSTTPHIEALSGASVEVETNAEDSEEEAEELPAIVAERFVHRELNSASPVKDRWLNRVIRNRLSEREKVVCRFMLGDVEPNWTRRWFRGTKTALILLPLAALPSGVPAWIVIMISGFAILLGPMVGGAWPGFQNLPASNQLAPLYSAFPVGFR
jgi:hypothetical protein